jgi:methionyl-tRNA formyltransferase
MSTDLGAPVLVEAVRGLVGGTIPPTPQDDARATYAPKVTPDDARLEGYARLLYERYRLPQAPARSVDRPLAVD